MHSCYTGALLKLNINEHCSQCSLALQTKPRHTSCISRKAWLKPLRRVSLLARNPVSNPGQYYGPGVRSPFSRFLALNAQVLQRGFHSKLHFREGTAEAFTSCFSTCQKSGLKPGPVWPAPFNGWEEITNICIFDFRCALGALDNDRRIIGLNRIERPDPSNKM